MSKNEKLYDERDIVALDDAGNYYCKHVSAMTREKLHSKSDIAAELAYRDYEIDKLKAQVEQLREAVMGVRDSSHTNGFGYPDTSQLKAQRDAWQKLNESLEATPAQCLSEHDAVVGRKAFIAGVNATGQGYNGELGLSDDEIIDLAELYVSRKIRQQAKGGE